MILLSLHSLTATGHYMNLNRIMQSYEYDKLSIQSIKFKEKYYVDKTSCY